MCVDVCTSLHVGTQRWRRWWDGMRSLVWDIPESARINETHKCPQNLYSTVAFNQSIQITHQFLINPGLYCFNSLLMTAQ